MMGHPFLYRNFLFDVTQRFYNMFLNVTQIYRKLIEVVYNTTSICLSDNSPSTQINKVVSHPTLPLTVTAHEDRHIRFFDNNTGEIRKNAVILLVIWGSIKSCRCLLESAFPSVENNFCYVCCDLWLFLFIYLFKFC